MSATPARKNKEYMKEYVVRRNVLRQRRQQLARLDLTTGERKQAVHAARGVSNKTAIDTPPKDKTIYVKDSAHAVTYSFVMREGDTIGTLKDAVKHRRGWPKECTSLSFGEQKFGPLSDHRTLVECGLTDNSYLFVPIARSLITIFIESLRGARVMAVSVEPTETVALLKRKIALEFGVPPAKQRLYFFGTLLSRDDYTMDDYHVVSEYTMDLRVAE
jgi:hypothetical protein